MGINLRGKVRIQTDYSLNFMEDGDIQRQYMICGVKDAKWVVLEGFDYGAEGL